MSKIAIIGTGYVGLVSGTMFADIGHNVICCDIDETKIENLKKGISPIYEENLDDIIHKNYNNGNLKFSCDIGDSVKKSDIIFIAVGTPSSEDGSADLNYVFSAAQSIGENMNGYKIIVDKSTVPVGTSKQVTKVIEEAQKKVGTNYEFEVISNPEFLREGTSVYDFMNPDRVVIGCRSDKSFNIMKEVYANITKDIHPIVKVLPETAELIKYASNAFLAVKIAYINEIADLCEKVGGNVEEVAYGMGLDTRISPHFLQAGPGYGGSCFPKDTKAICKTADENGVSLSIIHSAIKSNDDRKVEMVTKIKEKMGDLKSKKLCILGITFKPNTDDMRDSPSLAIIPGLVHEGAQLTVYDPQGEKEFGWRFADVKDSIKLCSSKEEAISGSDAVVIITHWDEFKNMDLKKVAELMKGKYFFDLRNIYSYEQAAKAGLDYVCIGKHK